MITLSLLKHLEDEGFGTIDVDLFFQKLTLDKKGLYISDIGDPVARHGRESQSYEIYARGNNDTDGYKKLLEIRKYLIQNYHLICDLPAVPPVTDYGYENIELLKPSTITNAGLDGNNHIIYVMSGTIIYKEA